MHPRVTAGELGWIEVVAGCMFSGKTEELLRRIRRARYANRAVAVFKPEIDKRYGIDTVGSHEGERLRSFRVLSSEDILVRAERADVVGIDEAQFFDMGLVDVCETLANVGKRVVVAGLDLDYLGEPFGPMPVLLAKAEYVQKVLALCVLCGAPADRTQRVVPTHGQVLVGEREAYQARCRQHWDPTCFDPVQEALPFGPNLAEM